MDYLTAPRVINLQVIQHWLLTSQLARLAVCNVCTHAVVCSYAWACVKFIDDGERGAVGRGWGLAWLGFGLVGLGLAQSVTYTANTGCDLR